MKAWGILLAAVALAAVPGTAAAKPGYYTSKQGQQAKLHFRASNGYRVKVEASARHGFLPNFSIEARKGPAAVTYRVNGSLEADGSINVHLPHVGRIRVQFDPVHVTHRRPPSNCKGRSSIVEHGHFRGTIELHGEREFMAVDRHSARGRVVHSFRRVCKGDLSVSGLSFERRATRRKGANFTLLLAGHESPVLGFGAGLLSFGSEPPEPFFYAQRFRFREGMIVFTQVSVDGEAEDFAIPEPGEPKVAEVAPPAPFEGSATFTLTSPKKSSWEGDLAVELPGIGRVSLAGPKFWSELCEGKHCAGTASGKNHVFQIVS